MTHQYDVKTEKIINPDTGYEDIVEMPLVAIDIITSFQAPSGGEIDFSEIRKFLFALKNAKFNIGIVSYDQWNSAGERQTLEKAGFNVVRRSVDVDKSMYDDLVIMMSEKRLTGGYAAYRNYTFAGQPMRTCIIKEELQNLVELRGKRIDHRPGGSKDESDAACGSIRGAIEFGVWRCGVGSPLGEKKGRTPRAMESDAGESKIMEKMRAISGMSKMPDSLGYRGNPAGIR